MGSWPSHSRASTGAPCAMLYPKGFALMQCASEQKSKNKFSETTLLISTHFKAAQCC